MGRRGDRRPGTGMTALKNGASSRGQGAILVDNCLVCRSGRKDTILDLGPQPVSSHFASAARDASVQHALGLAVCERCGMVQLSAPFPYRDLISPHRWLTLGEPEAHLDAVVDNICRLPGLRPDAAIGGISVKDRSTLERLRARGFANARQLELTGRDGVADAANDFVSIQALLTPAAAGEIAASRGPFDLIVARHIVEHASAPRDFLAALGALLAPGGHLVVEVPDCRGNLLRQDYTMIWEEHVLYLTPQTVSQLLGSANCREISTELYPLPYENVIVLCAQKSMGAAGLSPIVPTAVEENRRFAQRYADAFGGWTAKYRALFERLADGRRLAAYGAGHLTSGFLNYHGLADYFAFVVDDTPQKQGLFLPKSGLPIVPRSRLDARKIGACLFGLSPALEERIIQNNAAFVAGGGEFYSLLVDSPRSIRNLL